MYGNGGTGPIAGAGGAGALALTGGSSFTVAIVVASIALVMGGLLVLRNQWMRNQETV